MGDFIQKIGLKAKAALPVLSSVPEPVLNEAFSDFAQSLLADEQKILAHNKIDLAHAREKNLSDALIDRLTLTPTRIQAIASSVQSIAAMPSPVNKILSAWDRPNGLHIERVSVPLGVLGIIYESRPNVTVDAACLSLKSRNVCILRGGSESLNTSKTLYEILQASLTKFQIPNDAVQFIDDPNRQLVGDMLAASGLIDVIIPRGGKGLTARVMNEAKMPVFTLSA